MKLKDCKNMDQVWDQVNSRFKYIVNDQFWVWVQNNDQVWDQFRKHRPRVSDQVWDQVNEDLKEYETKKL